MARTIGIMSESGGGKTTSLRNLDPKTTVIFDCDKKGLTWKGWRTNWNAASKNYIVTDFPQVVLQSLHAINEKEAYAHIKTIVIDTINGLMVADENRRRFDKGYDKWSDLAWAVYDLFDYALTMREDLTVIFIAHCQTERDENGFQFTRIKTSGKKLDKITLESKLNTVILAKKTEDGRHVFVVRDGNSTVKTPMGAFDTDTVENDLTIVLNALEEY